MKKLLMIVSALAALSLLAPSSSFARNFDKDFPDYMGMFITSVNGVPADYESCTPVAFLQHLTVKIILMNASIASTGAFECGWDVTGGGLTAFNTNCTITYAAPGIEVGVNTPSAGTYNIIYGFGAPLALTPFTELASLDVFYLDMVPLDFTLRNANPPSIPGVLPVFASADYVTLYPASVIQNGGSATIHFGDANCDVTLPTEDVSWGAVKSLFR